MASLAFFYACTYSISGSDLLTVTLGMAYWAHARRKALHILPQGPRWHRPSFVLVMPYDCCTCRVKGPPASSTASLPR
ncbi:unnamed protein product [Peniophora sp. CBMAI 1063]|nr:unnamed protein product [Peniophora sp. CBMAI 1063]